MAVGCDKGGAGAWARAMGKPVAERAASRRVRFRKTLEGRRFRSATPTDRASEFDSKCHPVGQEVTSNGTEMLIVGQLNGTVVLLAGPVKKVID